MPLSFRSSKVFYETVGPRTSASLYEAIDRYLQVLKDGTGYQLSKQEVIEKYGKLLSDENIREFYRRVAHQKDTLINRCVNLFLYVINELVPSSGHAPPPPFTPRVLHLTFDCAPFIAMPSSCPPPPPPPQ